MNWVERLRRRLRGLFDGGRVERELSDEIRHHIDLEARELIRDGWQAEAARREAFRRFGGEERTKERVRDERGGRLLSDLLQDIRYAARSLSKSPGFTLSALLVLALGIGASAAVLGVVRGVLLRPLPFSAPERLVRVWPASPERGNLYNEFSLPDFLDWESRSETLSSMGLYFTFLGDLTLTRDGEPAEQLGTVWVAGDFFGTLGVPPALGSPISAEDIEASRTVLVLSDGAWRRAFGADPGIVGQAVTFNYQSFEVIGVMPAGFSYPEMDTEAWVPLTTIDARGFPYDLRQVRYASAVGRLANGRTRRDVRVELGRIAKDLAEAYPESNSGITSATVTDLREYTVGDVRVALWSLLGAVGFFLLLATTNVANLLIARGAGRERELALRRSLGASSARVARQLLTESGLIAIGGGVLGVVLSSLLVRAVATGAVDLIPRVSAVRMDVWALIGALFLSVLVASVAGVWPAMRGAGVDPVQGLREGGRQLGGGVPGLRMRRSLVAGEVALAVILLVGAGLLIRSFSALTRVDPGFEPQGAVAMTVSDSYPAEGDAWFMAHERILEQVRAIPGVETAGAIAYLPFRGEGEAIAITVEGVYEPEPGQGIVARSFPVTTDAFAALGTRVLRGRDFLPSDGPNDLRVAIVNEAMVREVFQGKDPIGHQLVENVEFEVVGVVEDVRHAELDQEALPAFYTHMRQSPRGTQSYIARTSGDPSALFGPMRAAAEAVGGPRVVISEIVALGVVASEVSARPRFITAVMAGFALLALVLAMIGVYGVLAYIVRGRSREMGLRSALGASRGQIMRDVMVGGMRPALGGLAVGLGAAALLSRFLQGLLFQVEPLDMATFVVGGLLLAAVAAMACAVPALWAARVDPIESLRAE